MKPKTILALSAILSAIFLNGCGPKSTSTTSSTPTPLPTATAVPTPISVPTATPTPVPILSYFEVNFPKFEHTHYLNKQTHLKSLKDNYDSSLPAISIGEKIEIRLSSGLMLNGTLISITNNALNIETFSGTKECLFSELDAVTKFRVVPDFRDEIINICAAHLAYLETVENFDFNETELTSNLSYQELLKIGHTETLLTEANQKLESGEEITAFYTYGFLAKQNNVIAKRQLGLMYLAGKGVGVNHSIGKMLLQQAADSGDSKASEYLATIENTLKEKAQQDAAHARAVEEARRNAISRRATPTPRYVSRSGFEGNVEKNIFERPIKINGVKVMGRGAQIYREPNSGKYFYFKGNSREYISEYTLQQYKRQSGK